MHILRKTENPWFSSKIVKLPIPVSTKSILGLINRTIAELDTKQNIENKRVTMAAVTHTHTHTHTHTTERQASRATLFNKLIQKWH